MHNPHNFRENVAIADNLVNELIKKYPNISMSTLFVCDLMEAIVAELDKKDTK